jgi:hypothetical protein
VIEQLAGDVAAIRSRNVRIGHLTPEWSEHETDTGVIRRLEHIKCDGNTYQVTPRFVRSLGVQYHIAENVFRYFTPVEVLSRIQAVRRRSQVRLTTDGNRALALSDPARPFVTGADLVNILTARQDTLLDAHYRQGVVHTTHQVDGPEWMVGRDAFASTFTLDTPIDGFGLPQIHLSVLRLVCSNGLVAQVRAFRTDIAVGRHLPDGASAPLARALDCYSNEEGFMAVRQRLDAARQSEASVRDVFSFTRALSSSFSSAKAPGAKLILSRLATLTGDLSARYGVASVESITPKKRRLLPMDCTVYDLVSFATEVTSHHRNYLSDARPLNTWVGRTLATEFDLEGGVVGQPYCEERQTPAFFLN